MQNPVQLTNDLSASIYLTVPHDCKVGVCAHELGHLAFQWQDFYDPSLKTEMMIRIANETFADLKAHKTTRRVVLIPEA